MTARKIIIIYDGECPFCSAYVRMVRLKDAFDEVILVDARRPHIPLQDILMGRNIDLDQGMAVRIGDDLYHGADAMNILSLTATRSSWFNRIVALFFSCPRMAKLLYPVCKFFRRTALVIKGVGPIK